MFGEISFMLIYIYEALCFDFKKKLFLCLTFKLNDVIVN